jgi:hypothetical protein
MNIQSKTEACNTDAKRGVIHGVNQKYCVEAQNKFASSLHVFREIRT